MATSKTATKKEQAVAQAEPATKDTPSIYVGVDDGHFAVKVCREDGSCYSLPSRARPGLHQTVSFNDDPQDGAYAVGEENYSIVDNPLMEFEDTRFVKPMYPLNPLNRALVHHALMRAGFAAKDLRIVTGLPVDDFYIAGLKNLELIEGKKQNLLSSAVRNHNPNVSLARIVKHDVISEGIAAFFDLLYGFDGEVNAEFLDSIERSPTAIVDIGGKTTDIALVMEGGRGIYPERSGTRAIGALNLQEQVAAAIKAQLKLTQAPALQRIDEAIKTNEFELFGKKVDVSEIIKAEAREVASQVRSMMLKLVRDGGDVGRVVFVGGGSIALRPYIQEEYGEQAVFVSEPQFANARGMLKAAKYVINQD